MIQAPAVDGRRVESFFAELRRYAPNYTPDLNLSGEQGAGFALMRIFAHFAETVAVRLDQTPHKHFVAFLDRLGISLLPARAARAAVTFRLASGLEEAVPVPAGTRVTAPGKDDDIPFETTGELVAIPGVLAAAYGTDPQEDTIFAPPLGFLRQESRTPSELSYKIQSFVQAKSDRLQLDHTTDLEPGAFIRIGCKEKKVIQKKEEGGFVTLSEPVEQDFADGTTVVPIRNFEVFNGINLQEHSLYLGHSGIFTVKEKVEITMKVELKGGAAAGLQRIELLWQFWTKDEEATPPEEEHWKDFGLEFDGTNGFTTSGEVVLTKPGGFEIKTRNVGGTESRWIRAKVNEDGGLPVGRLLPEIETITVSVSTKDAVPPALPGIEADQGFYNATPLDVQVKPDIGFLPFGAEPRLFDQFYVASKEAFSKRESSVTLNFNLDLQTLAGPTVIKLNNGLRAYSIGLRRRLYELDLTATNRTWNSLGSPFEVPLLPDRPQGSRYVPAEDSIPAAMADVGSGSIYVFVKTEDALDEEADKAGRIWCHFHRSDGTIPDWFDLDAPPSATKKRVLFNPAAIKLPWADTSFGRVFVVGGDGKLYSRGVLGSGKPDPARDWIGHDPLGTQPKWISSPFVVVDGVNLLIFITGEGGLVRQLQLGSALTPPIWTALATNSGTNVTAASRPFAHVLGAGLAKVFVVSNESGTNNRKLFEWTRPTPTDPFEWKDLGRPIAGISTEGEVPAPYGFMESPNGDFDSEGLHIFLRGADNHLWERVDGKPLGVDNWNPLNRPVDPELRDSPVVDVDPLDATTTRLQVFSASVRNSLVRWTFEIVSKPGQSKASVTNQGVLLDPALASPTDNENEYVGENFEIVAGTGSAQSAEQIIAYDGGNLKRARLASPLTTLPDNTSECEIDGDDLGFARDDSDRIIAVHDPTPLTDPFDATLIHLRIRDLASPGSLPFVPVDAGTYSRLTGMVELNPGDVPNNGDYVLYAILATRDSEFPIGEDLGSAPELSWEYWNGTGWLSLNVTDGTRSLLSNGAVTIDEFPKSIQPTEVAGQENFWIRARLVGGDYGRETFRIETSGNPPVQKVVSEKNSLRPPKVRSLRITYKAKPAPPETCLAFNNLNYLDQTAAALTKGSHFRPFETLEDQALTVFFGFDKPFQAGPVRILLDAAERNYDESRPPEFEWRFGRDRKWKKLDVDDGSRALTRQGILTLSASEELTRETRFGESLFWIKGSLRTDRVEIEEEEDNESASLSNPCEETLDQVVESSRVSAATADYPRPLLRGVFPNTVWAVHGETITEEIVGSGDGEPDQTHKMQRADVLEGEDIRIRETLSAEEREQIERRRGKESVVDREDLGGTWVRWTQVKSLFDCGPKDRCYEIDRATGDLRFGDGTHGDMPPAGVDNIRAFRYRTGGGSIGNVATNKIEALATAVEGIESVFNPTPAGGGSDKADTSAMLTIGPRRISHRDRAVSAEDFEELAYEASREVAKARCLSTTNLRSNNDGPDPCDPGRRHQALAERGWVSLIIVPDSRDPRPCPSLELRRAVRDYLRDRAPSVIAASEERIVVRPPDYVTVSIRANIFVTTLENAAKAETQARTTLTNFLHPVHGGPEGKGWEFGRPISTSDIFALLERITDIDRVEALSFQFRGESNPDRVEIGPNELPASGEHELAIKKA